MNLTAKTVAALRKIDVAGPGGFEIRDMSNPGRYLIPYQHAVKMLRCGLVAEVRDTPNSIARYALTDAGRKALEQ